MKHVLILGATSDIAKAIAYHLAEKKINLLLAGRDISQLEKTSRDLQLRFAIEAQIAYFDALNFDSHAAFVQEHLQDSTIDGLILCYGYLGDQEEAERNAVAAKQIIDVNFTSCVSILHLAAAAFKQKQKGWICALSSVAGDRGRQSNYVYGSAKGALSIYLQGLRNKLHPAGIQVTTVKPGFVDTKMTYGQLKKSPLVAQPERVAAKIVKAIEKKKDQVYVPWFWFLIMRVIILIPEKIFKRLRL